MDFNIDFVAEPGQFSMGGIIDVYFSPMNNPSNRVFGDIESIRSFDLNTQISIKELKK